MRSQNFPGEAVRVHVGESMRKSLIIAVLIISLLTGSAAMGQKKYQRPAVKTPDSFRGAEGTGPTDQTSIGDLKWFEVFQDEELQRLVRTAMVQNYDLRLAVARINSARANVGLARSDQFPQFEVGADLTTTRTSANTGVNAPGQGGRTRSIGEVFLSFLTFEVDLWGRLRQRTKAARAQLRSTEEDRKTVATIVVSDVAANTHCSAGVAATHHGAAAGRTRYHVRRAPS